ncbi:acetyltransferase [Georgenia subflava]|uniref:Acetyltransferase n=1 Tax=Georgenia subflava TaxID=1622177 RepID=A0A6N7EKP6_9MICO|nr:acetyltransferase [Georgenia subflava]MPV37603.1 acetyltransferase [Georgenia subflava]
MTSTPLVIVGIGGFGREVIDVVDAMNASATRFELLGMLDDAPAEQHAERLSVRGVPYLGTVDQWLAKGVTASYVIGIANARVRRIIDTKFTAAGHEPVALVHPAASTGSRVALGPGAVVCAGARLTTNITIGRHTHVHVNATVGHDTVLEPFSSAYPLSAISGECHLGEGSTVGAHATVLQGRRLGADAFVGAGAVVTRDVAPGVTVTGVPARPTADAAPGTSHD